MKNKAITICIILFTIALCSVLISTKPVSYLDMDSLVSASSIYYDIKVKLIWDQSHNLDLYVTEPDGEIASRYNPLTVNGGEIGYYDENGEWNAGDSASNTAPEVYRIENAPEGTYKVDVYCPGTGTGSITTETLIYVTLYEESSLTEYKTFPVEGTQTVDLTEEGWWHAGTFGFKLPEDSGCFIATAVYGSSLASEVSSLCNFRDRYLLNNDVGKQFVKLYYKLSPPCAKFIACNPFLKKVVRIHLTPLVLVTRLFETSEENL